MKNIFKYLKWLFSGLVVLVAVFLLFVVLKPVSNYEAPFPDIKASSDPAVITRGKHLFYGAAHCSGCHAPRSELARLQQGEEVLPSGGEDFDLPFAMIYAPNITADVATGIGAFSDGEIARSLRYGVKQNGEALIDFMPFYDLGDEDLTAIISFLRTLPAVNNQRPKNQWRFLGKALRAVGVFNPKGDGDVPPAPATAATIEYGEYLAKSVANCRGCHTKRSLLTGGFVGDEYAGGMVFGVGGVVDSESGYFITPNLTPDESTGRMAGWTVDTFVQRFKIGKIYPESIMPWGQFKRMTDTELTALFMFFQSLAPVTSVDPIPVGFQLAPSD